MRIIGRLDEVSANYDALLVDLWGCVHNGITAYPAAVAALTAYRDNGGKVCLLTNSPKPRAGVEAQLQSMGVPPEAWDVIATSGDAARAAMFSGVVGQKVWFVGEPRDQIFFDRMALLANAAEIQQVALTDAEGIVCTGPFDPFADPSDLRPQLLMAKQMGLKLLCANPDIVVDRGESREWCAGAVAQLYTELGGVSLYFGKPHPPIYDLARQRLAQIGATPDPGRILAIGDGIHTDIQGAQGEDIDSLFLTGGLAASQTMQGRHPDLTRLAAFVAKAQVSPTYVMGFLG